MTDRKCFECGVQMKGRSDKKFCSDQCRSACHNRVNFESNGYVRTINNVLRRNRRILDDLNPGGNIKVPSYRLLERGFDFRYHTSSQPGHGGGRYFYCYEQGYLPLKKNYLLLVRQKDFKTSPKHSPEKPNS